MKVINSPIPVTYLELKNKLSIVHMDRYYEDNLLLDLLQNLPEEKHYLLDQLCMRYEKELSQRIRFNR